VVQQSYIDQKVDFNDPASVFKSAPLPHTKKIRQHDHPGGTDTGESDDKQVAGLNAEQQEMRIVSISQAEEKSKSKPKEDESQTMSYLPAGSIITGTLINGMDAPTGQGARKDPFHQLYTFRKRQFCLTSFAPMSESAS
jgi:conjugal transfer pilus assembly protein TraB